MMWFACTYTYAFVGVEMPTTCSNVQNPRSPSLLSPPPSPPTPRYIYFLPLLISLVYHNEGLATALTLAPVVVALVFAVDCGVARRLDRATLADQGKPRAKTPTLHFVGAWCLAVTIPVYLIFRGIVSRN